MKTQDKVDLIKQHKEEYAAPRKPVLIQTKAAVYLAISGQGAPGGAVFTEKIGALYGVAFTVKMTRKFGGQQDYVVGRLEAQWWVNSEGANFATEPKDQWQWRLMIRTPEFVKLEEVKQAIAKLIEKGKGRSAEEVGLESLDEGLCVQMLHVGPYQREPETIAIMKASLEGKGLAVHGRHHEIYLSDPRRVAPEKLKTILRLPVAKRAN